MPGDEFDEDQRQGEDVRPRPRRAALLVELLGGAVARRERRGPSLRLLQRRGEARVVDEHLRDAEVEHLHGALPPALDDEEVGWLHVAVRDLVLVRDGERAGCGLEQVDGLGHRVRRISRLFAGLEVLGERLTFEPLQHEIRHPHAGRRDERAHVQGLHDPARGLRESVQEPPLFAELLEQRGALLLGERVGELQALDGDELAEADVDAAVHHAEAAVADDRRDPVFPLDRRAAELERILRGLCFGHRADR